MGLDEAARADLRADLALLDFQCRCGHLIRQERSEVDGAVLWFHHGQGPVVNGQPSLCRCELVPGCRGMVAGWAGLREQARAAMAEPNPLLALG